jgi:type IV secretion system protein VirD4
VSWRETGIYLGQVHDKGRIAGEARYGGGKHLITIGPNGSGKGTGLIAPNLAHLRRSILLIDPKGEAAAITARQRAKLGRVVILNPFNVLADERPYLNSQGFNPLASLDRRSPHFPDAAAGIAEALIKIEGSDPHWAASAQDLVAALIMWECIRRPWAPEAASLGNVRKMLTEPYVMGADGKPAGLLETVFHMLASGYAPLEAKAGRFVQASREMQAIVSSAITQTRFLDSPAITADLAQGGLDFGEMKRSITTVYLILPANYLETHSGWLRLMVVSALRALLQTPPSKTLPPVLFMLDEFAQLGYLPPIENAMGIARGFGVQLWPFLQDLNQLKALYKARWETFIGARGVLTAFAPQDWFTAEYLSKLSGQTTKLVESWNESDDLQGSGREGRNWAPQGFPLFRPEELMGMGAGRMLCFVDPVPNPFFTEAPGYWDTRYKTGLDRNPYYR